MNTLSFSPAKGLLLGLLLSPGVAGLAHAETLKEIYQQAIQNDHQFKAAQANLAAGQEAPALGRSQLLPQIVGDASLTKNDFEQNNSVNATRNIDQSTTDKSYGVNLTQPLFNLVLWNRYKQGQTLGSVAEEQFKSEAQSLILRTSNAYFGALKAVDNYNTAKSEEAALARQLEQTKQRFQVGLIAITEVHEAQAAFDSANANRLSAEGQVGIAAEAVEVLTGKSYLALSPLQTKFPVQSPVPEARQEWVDFALANNSQLKVASLQAKSATYNAKAMRAEHLPTVTGVLGYNKGDSSGDMTLPVNANVDEDTTATSAAIRLRVPIFAGGYTSASSRQAKNQQYAAEETKLQAERDIVQATRTLHLQVVTGVATVKARQQSIVSGQSALDATRAGYEVGTRDLVDLLNAQRSLFLAQRNYYDALYTYVLNTLQLKEAAGLLNEKDIEALDSWLDKATSVKIIPER